MPTQKGCPGFTKEKFVENLNRGGHDQVFNAYKSACALIILILVRYYIQASNNTRINASEKS